MEISILTNLLSGVKFFNRWIILFVDLFLSIFSTFTSLTFLWYILGTDVANYSLFHILLLSLCCSLISFFFCQTYKGVIRHSTFTEAGRLALSSLIKVLLLFILLYNSSLQFSLRELILGAVVDLFLLFFLLTISRVLCNSILHNPCKQYIFRTGKVIDLSGQKSYHFLIRCLFMR